MGDACSKPVNDPAPKQGKINETGLGPTSELPASQAQKEDWVLIDDGTNQSSKAEDDD